MVIIRCMAENFGDEKKILDCRNCFKTVGDYMSAGGLPRAKRCADMFWTDISRVRIILVVLIISFNLQSLRSVLVR